MQKENTILEVKENALLMQFMIQNLKSKSRDNIKSLLRNRQVFINNKPVSQYNHELKTGQQVVIKWERAVSGNLGRNLRLVYEDESILVVDKQAGLLSISDGTERETAYSILSRYVKLQNPTLKIFIVHRLDRDTSGLMIFAKSDTVQRLLQENWQKTISQRTYIAVVEGKVEKPEDTIKSWLSESKALVMYSGQDPAKGELAVTHYKTLKFNKDFSLLEINLLTGKKNQIRVHMHDIGHSIIGDKKYGANGNPIGRLGLHASILAFSHPVNGNMLKFKSDIPERFLQVFHHINKN